MSELSAWGSYYMVLGSASGALIGLQFVALTLIAQRSSTPAGEAGPAFATPTIVHFSVALFLALIGSAPWPGLGSASIFWGVIGLTGIAYAVIVIRRMIRQSVYDPVFEDWLFHALLPLSGYAMLATAGLMCHRVSSVALFLVGGAALIFLLVGIHNAWDALTYHVFANPGSENDSDS